jgi:hypothetical protein
MHSLSDRAQDAFQILQHIMVGEAKDDVATRLKPFISARIPQLTRLEIMRCTVDFDNQSRGMTGKISNIGSHRNLSTEAKTACPMRLEIAPQQRLRARH